MATMELTTHGRGTGADTSPMAWRRQNAGVEEKGAGTSHDENVIAQFGKKQQLKRRFKSLSSLGLVCGLMLTWESELFSLQYGLANGGPAGVVYGFLGAWFGALLQSLVMAELASMIPLAGGPFNWVAILSPPFCRKFLSYAAGWMTNIGYQAFVSAVIYTNASLIQGLVILNYPNYDAQRWHATLIFYAITAWAIFVNTALGRILPRFESLTLIFYVIGFFGVLIPLAYLAPHRPAAEVFGQFQNQGEWDTIALATFVGWFTSLSSFIGADGADHVAEEVYDAPRTIPFTIWFSVVFNGILGFAMLLTVLFCIQDLDAATDSETGYPFMDIFVTALGSQAAGNGIVITVLIVNIFSTTSCIATASRTLWAFSRENGLPGSKYLVKVHPTTRLPINSIITTMVVNCILALVSIGSLTAYDAFYSVVLAAYYSSFLIAASVMLYKRLTTPASELPWGPFRLGRLGTPITVVAIAYTSIAMFFSFWPADKNPTPASMNYSSLIFGASVIFSLFFWVIHGRKVYVGPIWELEGEIRRVR